MNNLLVILFILAIIFVLTYDPKSRTLENYFQGPPQTTTNCEASRYQSLQFAQGDSQCIQGDDSAIIQ